MTDDVEVLKAMIHDLYLEHPERPTLFDHFAGMAMQGLMANPKFWTDGNNGAGRPWSEMEAKAAEEAYGTAEAMLKERARRMQK